MIPRKRIDISYSDLVMGFSFLATDHVKRSFPKLWKTRRHAMITLSLRTGWDAFLSTQPFPKGAEIMMSAVTISDMEMIVRKHGYVPVPIPVDLDSGELSLQSLEKFRTENTAALVVVQLFGMITPLDRVAEFCQEKNIFLIEDCAHSYTGPNDYRGHSKTDLVMHSFGPIKTSTALCGGILEFADKRHAKIVRKVIRSYPTVPKSEFLKRLILYSIIHLLTHRLPYTLFVRTAKALGKNHDGLLSTFLRGFSPEDFFEKLRRRPNKAQINLLLHRLSYSEKTEVAVRVKMAEHFQELTPSLSYPGSKNPQHSFWIYPVRVSDPESFIHQCWKNGWDATRGQTSLRVLESDAPEIEAMRKDYESWVYLPVNGCAKLSELPELAKLTSGA